LTLPAEVRSDDRAVRAVDVVVPGLARATRARSACLLLALYAALSASGCRRVHGERTDRVIDPSQDPVQADEPTPPPPLLLQSLAGPLQMTRLARYRISARVLSRERYFLGWRGEVSPIDLALGWGRMANPEVDDVIDWHQGGRWYFYSWSGESAYQTQEISVQSANVHIVPATRNLSRALLRLDRGQLVALSGSLVHISDAAGRPEHTWHSSLSRSDVGDGACELLYVESLETEGFAYR
jgi:hypothetical protein